MFARAIPGYSFNDPIHLISTHAAVLLDHWEPFNDLFKIASDWSSFSIYGMNQPAGDKIGMHKIHTALFHLKQVMDNPPPPPPMEFPKYQHTAYKKKNLGMGFTLMGSFGNIDETANPYPYGTEDWAKHELTQWKSDN